MITMRFVSWMAVGLFVAAVGCGGSSEETGGTSTGSGGPQCDAATQGFVSCGPQGIAVTCQPGTFCSNPDLAECTSGCASNVNCGCGETCQGGSCVAASKCGDGACNGTETPGSCPADCASDPCGNGVCDQGESATTCPLDCSAGACGDLVCGPGESFATCPSDCAPPNPCGDGFCDPNETPASCPADCGPPNLCGNGTCDPGETPASCPTDCQTKVPQCKQECEAYDFFSCFGPGELQSCYDACDGATDAQITQFLNCAGPVSCDLGCLAFL